MKYKNILVKGLVLSLTAMLLTGCSVDMESIADYLPYLSEKPDWLPGEPDKEDDNAKDDSDAQEDRKENGDDGDSLGELAFDEFLEQIFVDNASADTMTLHFYLADPENYGITPGPVDLGHFGYEDKAESLETLQRCRKELESYDRDGLDREQRIAADILASYLDSWEADLDLDYYYEPFKTGMGLHASLPYTFAEYAFYDRQDVDDYLELLTQVGGYFETVLEWEEKKADEGLFMADGQLDKVLEECQAYIWDGAENFFLHETFAERLETVQGLKEEEKEAYLQRDQEILLNEFSEAYRSLTRGLERLRGRGVNDEGICYLPRGEEYYEYLIESNIGMTYESVDALYEAVGQDIIGIYDEMYELYQGDEELWDSWGAEEEDRREPEEMLEELKGRISEDFPEGPENSYQVKHVPKSMEEFMNPAFYMIPPIDRYQDNVIYINRGMIDGDYNLFAVLAHEGYPGHLYQTVYYADREVSNFRKMMDFSGYSEGWGVYAEYYSYGWMKNMEPGVRGLNLLSERLNMALSTLMDIGINYYGWTRADAADMLEGITGAPSEDIVEDIFSYVVNDPAGYLDYYVGYLEIRKMAEEAEAQLGPGFDIREFHRFILDLGPAPFNVIRPYFLDWMAEQVKDEGPVFESEPQTARLGAPEEKRELPAVS